MNNQKSQQKNINILQEIKEKKVSPVYLLSGTESFLIEATLKQILDSLLPTEVRDFNLSFLDGTQVSMKEAIAHVEVCPMMSDWRVVVMRDPDIFKKEKKQDPILIIQTASKIEKTNLKKSVKLITDLLDLSPQSIKVDLTELYSKLEQQITEVKAKLSDEELQFLQHFPDKLKELELLELEPQLDDTQLFLNWLQEPLPRNSVLILVVNSSVDARSRIVKQIQKIGRNVVFVRDNETKWVSSLSKKIRTKLASFNKEIEAKALRELIERSNRDMYQISKAIEKIIDFIGDSPKITEKDIEAVVTQNQFDNIFQLTDAIGAKSLEKALKALYEVIMDGEPALKISSLITRQFRLALQAKLLCEITNLETKISSRTNYTVFRDKIFKGLVDKMIHYLPEAREVNILKQNPYAAYKVFQTSATFSVSEMVIALEKLLQVDKDLKSNELNDISILEELICDLCISTNTS